MRLYYSILRQRYKDLFGFEIGIVAAGRSAGGFTCTFGEWI